MHSKLFLYSSDIQTGFEDSEQWLEAIFPLIEPFWEDSKNRYRLEPVDLRQNKHGRYSDQTVIAFIREQFNRVEHKPDQFGRYPWVRPILIIDEDGYQKILNDIQKYGVCWVYHETDIDRFIVCDTKGQFHRIVRLDDRGKFDWCIIGGRFAGTLPAKPNCEGVVLKSVNCDALPKRCIDTPALQNNEYIEQVLEAVRQCCQYLEHTPLYWELETNVLINKYLQYRHDRVEKGSLSAELKALFDALSILAKALRDDDYRHLLLCLRKDIDFETKLSIIASSLWLPASSFRNGEWLDKHWVSDLALSPDALLKNQQALIQHWNDAAEDEWVICIDYHH